MSEKEIAVLYIPMNLDTDDMGDLKYNKTLFNKGLKDASYMVGHITALLNSGLSKEQVTEIVLKGIENGVFGKESV